MLMLVCGKTFYAINNIWAGRVKSNLMLMITLHMTRQSFTIIPHNMLHSRLESTSLDSLLRKLESTHLESTHLESTLRRLVTTYYGDLDFLSYTRTKTTLRISHGHCIALHKFALTC